MADAPPLLFTKVMGGLRPANAAATEALKGVQGTCRVRITRVTANQQRRAYYWVMLAVAAQSLQDATDMPWDAELLHDELKRRLQLGEEWKTPSGVTVFKPRSTSDKAMSEPDRARWTDRCANVLSVWLGVPVATLMDEARAQHEQTFAVKG